MEQTACIFNTDKSQCIGTAHSHLNNLMCGKHLKEYFGLEIFWSTVDTPTSIAYAGFTLKPAKKTYFKVNDIIIPCKTILDKTYRKEHVKMLEKDRIYRINPVLNEFMLRATKNIRFAKRDRYSYEIIRNLSTPSEKMNTNPTELCENTPESIAYIRSKYSIAETYIQKHSTQKHMNGINLISLLTGDFDAKSLFENEELSLSFKYMLSKCEYSNHITHDTVDSTFNIHRLHYNAAYVPDIGLVATRNISHPNVIVVWGSAKGTFEDDDGFYTENVILDQKEVLDRPVSAKNLGPLKRYKRAFDKSCM